MAQVGMTLGVSWSTASNGAILSLLVPIFGALIAVWLLRERLSILRIAALLLGLGGVLLLSPLHSTSSAGMRTHQFAGNIFIAAGCLGSAFYNVYSKRLLNYFSGFEILLFSYLFTTVFSLPLLFVLEPQLLQQSHSSHADPVGCVWVSRHLSLWRVDGLLPSSSQQGRRFHRFRLSVPDTALRCGASLQHPWRASRATRSPWVGYRPDRDPDAVSLRLRLN